jgi:hypothetical protein
MAIAATGNIFIVPVSTAAVVEALPFTDLAFAAT